MISGYRTATIRTNISFANSLWTKQVVDHLYGIDSSVLYPPVGDDFPRIAWEDKQDGFVFTGRISPDKRPLRSTAPPSQL